MLSYTVPATTPAEVKAYHAASGATGWPEDETTQAQTILRGQRYIAARFNSRWAVEFENDAAPDEIRHAIAEAALFEARTPGALAPTTTPATAKVLVGVNGLRWERIGGAGADGFVPRLAIVEGLLKGLVRAAGSSILVRL